MKTMKRICRLTVALAIAAALTGALNGTAGAGAKGESTDMEMLRGYGQTEWSTRDMSRDAWLGVREIKAAVAAAPMTKGFWSPNDKSEGKEHMRLSVEFYCWNSGVEEGFPYSYLQVMWFQDYTNEEGNGNLAADDPPLARDKRQKWGWSILARWDVSIGGSGAWQLSYWKQGRPSASARMYKGINAGWSSGTIKDIYVYSLKGDDDQEGSLGSEGSGLAEAEVRRLQRADVLMFRLPYEYVHRDDYETTKVGGKEWKLPKKGARMVRGENEWHVSMKGSRDAIQAALDICQSKSEEKE